MPTLFAMSGYLVWAYAYINIYTLAFLLLQHGFLVSSVFASLLWKSPELDVDFMLFSFFMSRVRSLGNPMQK